MERAILLSNGDRSETEVAARAGARAGYPSATKVMKKYDELWRFTKLRQRKQLNNIVEQDNRRIKRPVRPGLGFKGFHT